MNQAASNFPHRAAHDRVPVPEPVGQEFLIFRLGGEEYGIEILKVQEIRSYATATAIAHAPAFIKGVVNLRGSIVPIIDMRIRFDLERAPYDEYTVVVMLNVAHRVIGMIVDAVSDVIQVSADAIRPVPQFASTAFDTRYITGLGAVDDRMLILVDIEKLMTSSDMALMDGAAVQ